MNKYRIEETKCYLCKYKVVHIGYKENNATYLYHRTREEALAQIKKFNGEIV